MQDYKNTHVFKYERDSNGEIYNRFDNYLSCRGKGKIWRYDSDILVFESFRRTKLKKVDKASGKIIFDYTYLFIDVVDTDGERLIYFKEDNFDKVKSIFKIKEKRKMSEEAKEAARIRLQEYRKNKGIKDDITEDDIDEELNNAEDIHGEEIDIEEDDIESVAMVKED